MFTLYQNNSFCLTLHFKALIKRFITNRFSAKNYENSKKSQIPQSIELTTSIIIILKENIIIFHIPLGKNTGYSI